MPYIKEQKIMSNGVAPIGVMLLSLLLTYLANVMLARLLQVDDYGTYAIVVRVCSLFAMVSLLGTHSSVMNFLPKYYIQQRWFRVYGFLTYHVKKLIISFTVVFSIQLLCFLAIYWHHHFFNLPKEMNEWMLFIWLIPLYAMMLYMERLFQAMQRMWWSLLPIRVFQFLFIMLAISGYYIFYHSAAQDTFRDTLSLDVSLVLTGAAILLVVMIQVIVAYGSLPSSAEAIEPWASKRPIAKRAAWRRSELFLFLSACTFEGIKIVDLLMIRWLDPARADVAIFAVLLLFSAIFWACSQALRFHATPLASRYYHEQKWVELRQLVSRTSLRLLIGLVFLWVLFAVIGQDALLYFGPVYQQGFVAMLIVLFGVTIEQTLGMSIILLQLMKLEKTLFLINLIGLLGMVILDIVFIPQYGLLAAAVIFAGMRMGMALCRVGVIYRSGLLLSGG